MVACMDLVYLASHIPTTESTHFPCTFFCSEKAYIVFCCVTLLKIFNTYPVLLETYTGFP